MSREIQARAKADMDMNPKLSARLDRLEKQVEENSKKLDRLCELLESTLQSSK
jgi:hypothetical protein